MGRNYWYELQEGQTYHIYNKCNSGISIFKSKQDYNSFTARFKMYINPYFDIHAYCLISNHFHFLIRVKPKNEQIELAMNENTLVASRYIKGEITTNDFLVNQWKRFLSSYASSYKNKYDYHGSIFLKRFKRILVKSESNFIRLLYYIHHNPIHHGLCNGYESWPFSSFNSYLGFNNSIVEVEITQANFKNQEEFLQLHKEFREEMKLVNAMPDENSSQAQRS